MAKRQWRLSAYQHSIAQRRALISAVRVLSRLLRTPLAAPPPMALIISNGWRQANIESNGLSLGGCDDKKIYRMEGRQQTMDIADLTPSKRDNTFTARVFRTLTRMVCVTRRARQVCDLLLRAASRKRLRFRAAHTDRDVSGYLVGTRGGFAGRSAWAWHARTERRPGTLCKTLPLGIPWDRRHCHRSNAPRRLALAPPRSASRHAARTLRAQKKHRRGINWRATTPGLPRDVSLTQPPFAAVSRRAASVARESERRHIENNKRGQRADMLART